MKIVFLILAHRPEPCNLLLRLLGERFAGLVHVDARVSLDQFDQRVSNSVVFMKERIPIFWGGFNMVQATLNLIRNAIQTFPEFERLALISGDCLPVVSLRSLEAFLSEIDKEYIEIVDVQDDPDLFDKDVSLSVDRYGWEQPWRFHNFVYWDHELVNPRGRADAERKYGDHISNLDWIRGDVQKMMPLLTREFTRRLPLFTTLYYGSQWWALSRITILNVYDILFSTDITNYFRYFRCGDEHFMQCIVGNDARSRAKMQRPFMHLGHQMQEDTEKYHLNCSTLSTIHSNTGCLFARKFHPRSCPMVVNAIERGEYFRNILSVSD